MISRADENVLIAIAEADGASFTELVEIAGLDPGTSFRGADLRDVDFGTCNLAGYDFTEANLTGASFRQAEIAGASFDDAVLVDVIWPQVRTSRSRRPDSPKLHGVQIEAVELMLEDIYSRRRAIAMMPTGSGRNAVIEEVIATIMKPGERALLVVSSAVERDMMVAQLEKRLRDVPIITLGKAGTRRYPHGLAVHNSSAFGTSFSMLFEMLDWHGRIDAIFATSTERLQQVLNTAQVENRDLLIAAVDIPLSDYGRREDRKRLETRIAKIFGRASFILSIDQLIVQGTLRPARIIAPFPVHPPLPKRRPYFAGSNDATSSELIYRMEPHIDALHEACEIGGLDDVFVLCADDQQARVAEILLNNRYDSPTLARRVGQRWSATQIAETVRYRGGFVISPVTRQAIDAARLSDHVAVLTELKMEYAQDIAFRPLRPDERQPLILDFSETFSSFPQLEYGAGQILDDIL